MKQNYNDIKDVNAKADRIQQAIDNTYEQFVKKEDLKATGVVQESDSRRRGTRPTLPKKGLPTVWKVIIAISIVATCATLGLIAYLVATSQGQDPVNPTPSPDPTPSPTLPVTPVTPPVGEENSIPYRALQDLYEATNGPNWKSRGGWVDPTVPICRWYGVTCKGGVLVALQLASNNLAGTIPQAISDLASLNLVDFTNNSIEGSLPSVLLGIHTLDTIKLGGNKLSGIIPKEWTTTGLVTLDISNNELTGTIPDMGIQLRMLSLNLSRNKFTGKIPPFVISRLDLSHNFLEGTLPSFTWSMKYLNLANNTNLFGNLTMITEMIALEVLDLSYNNFNDTLELGSQQLQSLKKLNIEHTHIKHLAQKEKIIPNFVECDASDTLFECPLPDWAPRCKATCQ